MWPSGVSGESQRTGTVLGQPVVGMNRPALGHSPLVPDILRVSTESLHSQTGGSLETLATHEGPGNSVASLNGPHTVLGQPGVGMNRPALGHSLP
jgi:hypothetical protein